MTDEKEHPARRALNEIGRCYPGAWRLFDLARENKKLQGALPPHVFATIEVASYVQDLAVIDALRTAAYPAGVEAVRIELDAAHVQTAMLPDPTHTVPLSDKEWSALSKTSALTRQMIEASGRNIESLDQMANAQLTLAAAWRPTQGIYRVSPPLLDALLKSSVGGDIPANVLRRMPEWCLCVEINREVAGDYIEFMWVSVVASSNPGEGSGKGEPESLLIMTNPPAAGRSTLKRSTILFRLDNRTLMESISSSNPGVEKSVLDPALSFIEPLVSVLLYLCSVSAEYRASDGSARQPQKPPSKIDKHAKKRVLPPNKPTIWATGTRMGAALDAAYTKQRETDGSANGHTVTGHIRRAHWHAFWSGPRDGERQLAVKWLPPIPVNLNDVPTVATVRPVTGKRSPPEMKT